MSNGKELETAGMFNITAIKVNKNLKLAPGKELLVDVPAEEFKEGMQLFSGEELADGTINWVEPKPLEKFLNPVDIHSLNFYPPGYESKLAELGLGKNGKLYRDSLYYSFYCPEVGSEGDSKFIEDETQCGSFVRAGFDYPLVSWKTSLEDLGGDSYRVSFIIDIPEGLELVVSSKESQLNLDVRFEPSANILKVSDIVFPKPVRSKFSNSEDITDVYRGSITIYQDFKVTDTNQNNLNSFLNYNLWTEEAVYPAENANCSTSLPGLGNSKTKPSGDKKSENNCPGIEPSHIQAIWKDKFQNTNLATKEFEERLQLIFKSCNSSLLDVYVENIDKPLFYSDSIAMLNYPKFKPFYDHKDGRVNISSSLAQRLNKHYAKKSKIYEEAAKKAYEKILLENQKLNAESDVKAIEAWQKNSERRRKNFNQELNMNLDEAYRQLGKKKTPSLPPASYRVGVRTLGWKNVDVYVLESTSNRTTLDYTDPNSKKRAVIKYEPITVNVLNSSEYDRIYCYAVGDKQNSFMRMAKENGKFTLKLNELVGYSVICVGYKGEEMFLAKLNSVEPKLYELGLEIGSKKDLKKLLKKNANDQSVQDIQADLKYKEFEQKDSERRTKFKNDQELRRTLEPIIFSCQLEIVSDKVRVLPIEDELEW